MVDSTNPRVMADNIKQLAASGGSGGTTVVANPEGAATDELEKIGIGDSIYSIPSYTPPAYSTTEYDTGEIWTDGSHIMGKVFVLNDPLTLNINGAWTSTGITDETIDKIINVSAYSGSGNNLGVCFAGAVGAIMSSNTINLINFTTYDSLNVSTFVLKFIKVTTP